MMYARPIIGAIGFLGALFAPPWIPALCIILLALRYRAWEAIALGLLVDLLWLAPNFSEGLAGIPLFTIASTIIVWGLEPLRVELLR